MSSTLIEVSEEAGVRYLHFSADWVQGAMRIQRPNSLELAYTREMMAGLLLREPPWPKNALLIGLGAGSLVKYIYHKLPATRMTVVEIDPQVEIIARLHFKLPDDPMRINLVIGDGAQYVLEDGKKFKSLKRHLRTQYNMSPEQYRERWNLPNDYPMTAPGYAEQRSKLAKQIGLGKAPRKKAKKAAA